MNNPAPEKNIYNILRLSSSYDLHKYGATEIYRGRVSLEINTNTEFALILVIDSTNINLNDLILRGLRYRDATDREVVVRWGEVFLPIRASDSREALHERYLGYIDMDPY